MNSAFDTFSATTTPVVNESVRRDLFNTPKGKVVTTFFSKRQIIYIFHIVETAAQIVNRTNEVNRQTNATKRSVPLKLFLRKVPYL